MALTDYDPVAANNATVLGVNIGEGTTAPSSVNNAVRQLCADLAGGINLSLLSTFLTSTTLAQARTALGVTEGGASQTAFAALTNSANKVPYMTGSDAWSTADFTSFARTLVACGDASAAQTVLGIGSGSVTFVAASFTNPGYVKLAINGINFLAQWGTVTLGANSDGTITFPTAFSSFSVTVVSGGPGGSGDAGSIHSRSSSTTSASISNTSGGSLTGQWIAVGV